MDSHLDRRYSTLHSPTDNQPNQYALHTPIEPSRSLNNPYFTPQYTGELVPESPVRERPPMSFPPPPTSQFAADQYRDQPAHEFAPPPQQQQDVPGLPPLPGVETFQMTATENTRSPPPAFEQPQGHLQRNYEQGQPEQPRSPPPAFDPHDPNPMATAQAEGPPGRLRPPMPPMPIHVPSFNASDSTGPQTPKTPHYTPGAAAGPNGGIHAPGQIGHPNQQHGTEKYHHGLCDGFGDISTCCLGYWCPCILYSRTYHRLKTVPNSNVNEFKSCNNHCGMFCLLAPVSFILTTLQRSRIRENYRLEGSVANDCMKAYCCSCCTLIQDDREVALREDERRRFAGPGSGVVGGDGYRRQPTMAYQ